jgi:hypothetical protein
MFGSLVSSIKSRLSDESSRNMLVKLLNASYSLVSQKPDDSYCSENVFMLPRVYAQKADNVSGLWSPVSLLPAEKSLDELDDIVEKFSRCVSVESHVNDESLRSCRSTRFIHSDEQTD